MLTIAGSGINFYSLKDIDKKICWEDYDCLIADKNFNTPDNLAILASKIEAHFVSIKDVFELIKNLKEDNKRVLYVVSGSPIFYSVTSKLFEYLEREVKDFNNNQVSILEAESSRDYLLRKLKLMDNDVETVSFHGRNPEELELTNFLVKRYTFVLCDEFSINVLASLLQYVNPYIHCILGSKLGSEFEDISQIDLLDLSQKMQPDDIKNKLSPYVILIERKFEHKRRFSCDEEFETNAGMITKADKRALSMQALQLSPNLTLWDIGAGSGSVSIDAFKIFNVNPVLFEKNTTQIDFIKKNLVSHKVIGAKLYEGNVMDYYKIAPAPDRIFIGGGGEKVLSKIKIFYDLLKQEGLIVVNIVGLENLSAFIQALKNNNIDYEMRSIDISDYKKMDKGSGMSIGESKRTLFQFSIKK